MEILNLSEHIRILEELLLHQDFSASPQQLENMLGDDFREIDPDGREVSRASVMKWLLGKNPLARWEFSDFMVTSLADNLVLATYHARQVLPEASTSRGALHSSIWRENDNGNTWKLIFHQTTRIA